VTNERVIVVALIFSLLSLAAMAAATALVADRRGEKKGGKK
jgi:hypothetical protein